MSRYGFITVVSFIAGVIVCVGVNMAGIKEHDVLLGAFAFFVVGVALDKSMQ